MRNLIEYTPPSLCMIEGWVGAGIIAAGAVAGGAISAEGASNAAGEQASASENAQQISQNEFNTITQQETPFMQSGYGALSALDWGLGITPETNSQAVNQAGVPGAGTTPAAGSYLYGPNGSLIPQGSGSLSGQMSPQAANKGAAPAVGAGGVNPNIGAGPFANGQDPFTASGAGASSAGSAATGQPPGSSASSGTLGYGSLVAPFTTQNWQQLSPNYNFQLSQGQSNTLNSDAAGQGALSGSALKDLTAYNQGQASNSFNNAFNQYQTQQGNIFSRLSGIAQLGQTSAANTGQQGTALAGQAAQSATNIGTAQAGGSVGVANAASGSISSALPWLANAASSPTYTNTTMDF